MAQRAQEDEGLDHPWLDFPSKMHGEEQAFYRFRADCLDELARRGHSIAEEIDRLCLIDAVIRILLHEGKLTWDPANKDDPVGTFMVELHRLIRSHIEKLEEVPPLATTEEDIDLLFARERLDTVATDKFKAIVRGEPVQLTDDERDVLLVSLVLLLRSKL